MKMLAVDTSCDESCAAIIDTGRWELLADVVQSHVQHFAPYGGIVPEVASREHLKALPRVVHEALDAAKISANGIDAWVATTEPGLIGALLVGSTYAKSFAFALGKPFYSVDHLEGHLFSPLLATLQPHSTINPPPAFPWIAAIVSGGHTEIFEVKGPGEFRWLGGTQDDAAGEAFDKVGKLVGLPYPAGPLIDKAVQAAPHPESLRTQFAFPRAKLEGYLLSYSGLKTSVAQTVQKLGPVGLETARTAVLASAQEAILDTLVDKMRLAAKDLGISNLVVTGGVACNSRLRAKLSEAYFPSPKHCSDNAAMIALVAALKLKKGGWAPSPWETTANARSHLFISDRR